MKENVGLDYTVKNATDLLQVVNFTDFLQLVNKLLWTCQFIKLQQICTNQACYNLSFADLSQLIKTTCSKPVDDKF